MNEPTERQMAFIETISNTTGKPFKGKTRQDASRYIDENLDEFREASASNDPTPKQLAFIADIQRALSIPFTGRTKQDAAEYIDANIAEYRAFVDDMKDEAELEALLHEDAGDRPE